jgi:hypothetical protein
MFSRSFNTSESEHRDIEQQIMNYLVGHAAIVKWMTRQLRRYYVSTSKDEKKCMSSCDDDVDEVEDVYTEEGDEDEDEDAHARDGTKKKGGNDCEHLKKLIRAAKRTIIHSCDNDERDNACYEWLKYQDQLPKPPMITAVSNFADYDDNRKAKQIWSQLDSAQSVEASSTHGTSIRQRKKQKMIPATDSNNRMNDNEFRKVCSSLTKVRDNIAGKSYKLRDDDLQFGILYLNNNYPNSNIFIFPVLFYNALYGNATTQSKNYIKSNPLSFKMLIIPISSHDHYSLVVYIRPDMLLDDKGSVESCILLLDSCNNFHVTKELSISRINR